MITKLVCFVVCHGGPADHFATFFEPLEKNGYEVKYYASGPALKKLQERNISNVTSFNAENLSAAEEALLADKIAEQCLGSKVTMTDLAHSFDAPLLKALKERNIKAVAYYDNPEPYVPGGYSSMVAKASKYAFKVLFGNRNLVNAPLYQSAGKPIDLPFTHRIGLGYYPLEQVNQVVALRAKHHQTLRAQFLEEHKIEEKGKRVWTYFGGNNTEYFEQAFPAFLKSLSEAADCQDLSNTVIVFQQHPGAKSANLDRKQIEEWIERHKEMKNAPKIVISSKNSEEILTLTEGALYYQTSMGPLFALSGIQTAQVGHKVYEDVLVRGKLCSIATDPFSLIDVFLNAKEITLSEEKKGSILKALGVGENWDEVLLSL